VSTFCNNDIDQLDFEDFVIVRRSEDIGNHQRLVTANVVARHLDDTLGTHHSIDVLDLYKTLNIKFDVTSSDITTPSQLMHGVRFNLNFKAKIDQQKILDRLKMNPFVATSNKFDSNLIFELGRRYGFNGRIYSHAVVIENNILFSERSIKGWAFIPQEGNTLLSTINAFLTQTRSSEKEKVMSQLKHDLLRSNW
jgi:glyceraldehyde-3-phosphate dehydrogenase (NAD(P))